MRTEVALVAAARDGDRQAFAGLVERYERPVFSLAYRMLGDADDAEDAAQEAFLRAYRSLGAYDFHRPFSTWLLSITAHFCIDRLRRRRGVQSLDDLPAWRQVAGNTIDPEHAAEEADQADRIQAGLNALPDDYRLVLVLRYWHDFGYAEIAALVGETESAVKSRLHRARRQLGDLLIQAGARDAARIQPGLPDAPAASGSQGGKTPCRAIAPAS